MRKLISCSILFCLFMAAPCAPAQVQDVYYSFNGDTLEVRSDNPAFANDVHWQVWLYQEGVRIPRYTAGLQYSRWGVIEGTSAVNVMKRLKASQSFEEAYSKFFGPGTWGRYTFLNPLGPIAVPNQLINTDSAILEKWYHVLRLDDRVEKLLTAVQPSLENNESQGPDSPVKEYFDVVRDSHIKVSRLSNQLAHTDPQLQYINRQIAQVQPGIAQAENNVERITAILPSVKLPTSKAWMSQTENGGSEGKIETAITETGSGVTVQQTWTGGDGSMAGTVIVTTIPYPDIGNIELKPPMITGDNRWTVRVYAGGLPFPEKVDSPERRTVKRTISAVNYEGTQTSVYFDFVNPADAQDAYAYFLYHKQLGR
jgi:hypothetical protein